MKIDENGHLPLSIRQMTCFVKLAERGSISAAASALQMAQPSMSENIARLERSLGVQLVTRGARGVQFTKAGAILARRSAEILGRIDHAVTEIRNLSNVPRGQVNVGMPPGLSLLLSVPLLETIHAEYPEIRLSITEGLSGDILDWIDDERIDVGCAYDAYESETVEREMLAVEEVFLVTAPDNWGGEIGPDGIATDSVSVARLAELPVVMTSSRGAHALQQRLASTHKVELNVMATLNSLPQIVEMVSRASAHAILAHAAVHRQVSQGKLALVRIEAATLTRTAYLVSQRSLTPPLTVKIVKAYARSIMHEMVARYGIRGMVLQQDGS